MRYSSSSLHLQSAQPGLTCLRRCSHLRPKSSQKAYYDWADESQFPCFPLTLAPPRQEFPPTPQQFPPPSLEWQEITRSRTWCPALSLILS